MADQVQQQAEAHILPKRSQVLMIERMKALNTWLKKNNIRLNQVNGQRKYGGPPQVWNGPLPGLHCEVFISGISRDTYEDVLIPLFSSVGPLWEFRLMMNFSGQNRGFAYAKYATAAVANKAIKTLHGYPIEPSCNLSVRQSTEKRHLCIHNLPATCRAEDVLERLRQLAEGVEEVTMKQEPKKNNMSAIVAFSSHHTASMAKKVIVEAFQKRWSLSVSTRWITDIDEVQSSLRHTQTSQQLPEPLPVRPICPSSHPLFCRAPGGPAVQNQDPLTSSGQKVRVSLPVNPAKPDLNCVPCPPPQRRGQCVACPMICLSMLCENAGFGEPIYEIHYSHTGSNGFLYFTYKVKMAGVSKSFCGQVTILPGPPASTVLREAQREAAQQMLQWVKSQQFRL